MTHLKISCLIQDQRWRTMDALEELARNCFQACLEQISYNQALAIGILFGDDHQLQDLNHRFRNRNQPTNVLSFPNADADDNDTPYWGDIALSYDTISREANEYSIPFLSHVQHMLVHAFLHLAGYDHQTQPQREEMEPLEIQILEKLGIENPYLEK